MSFIAAAVIGGGLGLAGSLIGSSAQSKAAEQASQISADQFAQTRQDLDPWRQAGTLSLEDLMFRLGLSPRSGRSGTVPTREQFTTAASPGRTTWGGMTAAGIGNRVVTPGTPGRFDQTGYDKALADFEASQVASESDPNFGSLTRPFSLADFEESPAFRFNLEQGEEAINKGAAARGNYYAPQTLQDLGKFTQGVASNEFQNAFSNYNTNMNNIWNRLYGLSESGRGAATQIGDLGARTAGQIGENVMGAGNARAAGIVGGVNAITGAGSDAYNNYLLSQILGRQQAPNYGRVPGGLPGGADY